MSTNQPVIRLLYSVLGYYSMPHYWMVTVSNMNPSVCLSVCLSVRSGWRLKDSGRTVISILDIMMFWPFGDSMFVCCWCSGDIGESRGGAETSEHHQCSQTLLLRGRSRRRRDDRVGETSRLLTTTAARRLPNDRATGTRWGDFLKHTDICWWINVMHPLITDTSTLTCLSVCL